MRYLSFLLMALVFTSLAVSAQTEELPAISAKNKNAFFIPAATCEKYKLAIGQEDDWMKVYNNLADEASIQRVNDIRWQATNKEAAGKWYEDNKKMLSEDGQDITAGVAKPVGVDKWNVYTMNPKMKQMMDAMGVKQNHYYFVFSVDQYVAKIFIATTPQQTVADAWLLAKEGLRATLAASGKTKLAELML